MYVLLLTDVEEYDALGNNDVVTDSDDVITDLPGDVDDDVDVEHLVEQLGLNNDSIGMLSICVRLFEIQNVSEYGYEIPSSQSVYYPTAP